MRDLFSPPKFKDEAVNQAANLLYRMVLIMIGATTGAQILYLVIDYAHAARYALVMGVIDLAGLAILYFNRMGYVNQMSNALILIAWAVTTWLGFTDGGIHAPEVAAYFMITYGAGFVLGERAGMLTGLVCILSGMVMVFLEKGGLLPPRAVQQSSVSVWLIYSIFIGIIIGLQYLGTRAIHENFARAQEEHLHGQLQSEMHRLLIRQQEEERLKIARDLHDGPIQDLLGDIMMLHEVGEDIPNEERATLIERVKQDLHQQIQNLRDYTGQLRPPTLEKFGIIEAIRSHLDTYCEKYPEISVQFKAGEENPSIPEEVRISIYRIYQEGMNNIAKHAQATEVTIRFNCEKSVCLLEIRDNGVGIILPDNWIDLARQGHLGLVGIQERVDAIGGQLVISSRPHKGTTLRINVPI